MAINIEWQVKPPLKNEEKAQMFPRIIDSEMVNEQQLSKLIASHGSLSKGNAKAALNDLSEVMADLQSEGKTVCIPSLGSFKLSVGTDSEIHPDTDRCMQSIVVRGVNVQPSQEFMAAICKPSFLWKSKTGVAIAPTTDQLIPPAHHLLQDSRQHPPRRVRAHLRSEAHHRIYASEGTGDDGSDTGH